VVIAHWASVMSTDHIGCSQWPQQNYINLIINQT